MRYLVLAGCFFALTVTPSPILRACKVWTPVIDRVQESDLIVVGYVADSEENKYAVRTYEAGGRFDDKDRAYSQRWLHEARIVVTDVLKGSPSFSRIETDAEGNTFRCIRVLHDGFIQDSRGVLSAISTDDCIRPEEDGIWLLHRGEIRGTYRRESTLLTNALDEVKRCLEVLEYGYAGWTPGWPPDARTWVKTWGGDFRTYARAVVHADGDVTLSGTYRGELTGVGRRVLSSPQWDRFLVRLDPSGQVRWVHSLGCIQNFDPAPIAGHEGSTLLVGDVHQACSVLGTPMPWTGRPAKVIVSISPQACVEWTQSWVGLFKGVCVLPAAHGVYRVMGSFTGEVACAGKRLVAEGDADWFVGDLAADGSLRRLRRVDRNGDEHLHRIELGPNNDILFAGMRATTEMVHGRAQRTHDIIVGKMTDDGRVVWMDTLGGEWDDWPRDTAVAPDGMVVASMLLTPSELGRFDPHNIGNEKLYPGMSFVALCAWSPEGERLWGVSGAGQDVEIGADGNIYCLGFYRHHAGESVPAQLPPSAGDADLFIECYDRNGERLWVHRDGGMGAETPTSFALLPEGRALVTGGFEGISFLAGQTLRPRGDQDVFVMNVALPGDSYR